MKQLQWALLSLLVFGLFLGCDDDDPADPTGDTGGGDIQGDATPDVIDDTMDPDTIDPDTAIPDDLSADVDSQVEPSACDVMCANVIEASCDHGPPSLDGCISVCEDDSTGDCSADYLVLIACAAAEMEATCDEDGNPFIAACEDESAEYRLCIQEPVSDCETMCASVVAADCAEGPPTEEACLLSCEAGEMSLCSDEWDDVVTCTAELEFECSMEGVPEPTTDVCDADLAAWEACDISLDAVCEDMCDAVAVPACSEAPTYETCLTDCALELADDCGFEYLDIAECLADATYTCNGENFPTTEACSDEADAWLTCLE